MKWSKEKTRMTKKNESASGSNYNQNSKYKAKEGTLGRIVSEVNETTEGGKKLSFVNIVLDNFQEYDRGYVTTSTMERNERETNIDLALDDFNGEMNDDSLTTASRLLELRDYLKMMKCTVLQVKLSDLSPVTES